MIAAVNHDNFHNCEETNCYENYQVYGDLYCHRQDDGKGYIYNARTHKKLVRPVDEVVCPMGKDSLVGYYTGKKWGYFSKYTGKVIIEAKYDFAWSYQKWPRVRRLMKNVHFGAIGQTVRSLWLMICG